jgi:hypothetical protein
MTGGVKRLQGNPVTRILDVVDIALPVEPYEGVQGCRVMAPDWTLRLRKVSSMLNREEESNSRETERRNASLYIFCTLIRMKGLSKNRACMFSIFVSEDPCRGTT